MGRKPKEKPIEEIQEELKETLEPLEPDENGFYEYVSVNTDKNNLTCRFDVLFNREDIAHFNTIDIKMRKYYKNLPSIARDMNLVLNNYEDFAMILLKIRLNIYENEEGYPIDDFINDLKELYEDENIIELFDNYIEEGYDISLDTTTTKKINTDLQVTDFINKIVLKSAMMIRIVIPMLCDYANNFECNENYLFLRTFKNIIQNYSDGEDIVLNKLNKIVKSRVYQTRYSDIVMWSYLKNMSIDMDLLVIEIYNNIIRTIICKVEPNTSVITFLDVVIKKKIEFKFTYNYPISYKSIKIDQNDDDIDEKDKIEISFFISTHNEGDLYINTATIKQICRRFNYSNEDIEEFKEKILHNKNLNEIQKYFLGIFYSDKFDFNVTNEAQRVILLKGMIEELSNKGFNALPRLLSSTLNKDDLTINNRKLSARVIESTEYKNLSKKYLPVLNIFLKDNIIAKMVSFKNYKFIEPNEKILELDLDQYSFECIKFLNMI